MVGRCRCGLRQRSSRRRAALMRALANRRLLGWLRYFAVGIDRYRIAARWWSAVVSG